MSTTHSNATPPSSGRDNQRPATRKRPWAARTVFGLFLGIAAFFLITEHRAHLVAGLSWLPFLLLLACPFMHFFMHGGHGVRRRDGDGNIAGDTKPQSPGGDVPTDPKSGRPYEHGGDQP
jgi:Protein of unknown function (DUF2933)